MSSVFTSHSVIKRVVWSYLIYLVLVILAFATGYFLLPRGAFINTPWLAFGTIAAARDSLMAQFAATAAFNLGFVLVLGVGLNLQRVKNFPTGYVFIFSAGIVSGLIAGTNSFASQVISPYTLEGWLAALRIQHLELLGYTLIVASTIAVGLSDYSSWLPWRARERKIQKWTDIRFSRQELAGMVIGIVLILIGAYNETIIAI